MYRVQCTNCKYGAEVSSSNDAEELAVAHENSTGHGVTVDFQDEMEEVDA